MELFSEREIVIATKHKKEEVLIPLLTEHFGVKCIVPENYDTDELGTFTGEIERKLSPLETARRKCLRAMELTKTDLGIASEGSFGAHPMIPFVRANEEILIFIDTDNELEIIANEISTETNFDGSEITTLKELKKFSDKALFPSHAIILRSNKDKYEDIKKGIQDWAVLKQHFNFLMHKYGTAYAETDMRAMYNPSRMKIIQKTATKLIEKIESLCPSCKTPGYSVEHAKRGLRCSQCNFPTQSTLAYLYQCKKCGFWEEKLYPNGKTLEDPGFCDICNP